MECVIVRSLHQFIIVSNLPQHNHQHKSALTMSQTPSCRLIMGTVMRSCCRPQRRQLSKKKKKSPPTRQHRHASSTSNRSTTSCTTSIASTASTTATSTTPTTVWQRTAQKVKNTTDDVATNNQYLEQIRDMHDPSLHIKTLEEELLGSIGQALGKQGEKVDICLRTMQKHLQTYQQALLEDEDHEVVKTIAARAAYNEARQHAIQARWELLVHRQAAGFLVDNHNHVTRLYPIGPPLPVDVVKDKDHDEHETKTNNEKEKEKTTFGDQLDWWQRIGRWK